MRNSENHFHMGLDFRTENKENIRIIAVEDGYISRMVIAPNGYGKAIYIHHPQLGFTSVYAHLNAFRPDMEWWINQAQYARQLNAIDTSFAQAKFFVKKVSILLFLAIQAAQKVHTFILKYEICKQKKQLTLYIFIRR